MAELFSSVREKELQVAVHTLLSDPSVVYSTESGKRLQVLSPGRMNVNAGPDFLDIAILLNGEVLVGDGEFHRNSREWNMHNHGNDIKYSAVILHIVINDDDKEQDKNRETLVLDANKLKISLESKVGDKGDKTDVSSIEELQHYALLRLLRKASEAKVLINNYGVETAHREMTRSFVERYNSRRRRPVYNIEELGSMIVHINESPSYHFLSDISESSVMSIPDSLQFLLKTRFMNIGAHLRRELVLNCVLPIALCLANEESRINLFLWYWSTPAIHRYGNLSRRFKELPQNFLWQQQGMLEYIREHGRKTNVVSEALSSYGFAEVLSFYKLARPPFKEIEEDEF